MWISPYLGSPAKRCFDLVACLLVSGPAIVIMLLTALAVLASDGRPVVLLQPRAGRNGRVFRMPKFRTMTGGACGKERMPTRLGRFLRRHRLDELPQLLSVLLGQMGFVGPRPELTSIVAGYNSSEGRRLSAKPGATGLWQLMGSREKAIHEEIGYDLLYLRKASLLMDLRIVLLTALFMIRPKPWQV